MRALLIIDLQNDFLPGGALAVPEGNLIIPVINLLQENFSCIIASKDWHPSHHISFASQHAQPVGEVIKTDGGMQVLWPDHCIQDTPGAAFSPQLNTDKIEKVVFKGIDLHVDSYSAFYDNAQLRSTGLEDYLRQRGVDEIVIVGLATEYCVKYSALDAIQLGFKTIIISDACMGIDLQKGDSAFAIKQMKEAGARILKAHQISDRKPFEKFP